ncbi:MAG: succinate dehydrogenase iron-sulfur subunit [Myxococcaceae bacterium]|nr:succinate dehydrogenase iron-sulfur subunit [Myxococcaceae bacterium]MCI0670710.1 succinate dehydrogenase iron-sulfur subunit [Myxococcaceae bacterium]
MQETSTGAQRFVTFRIWRQESRNAPGGFEEFRIPYRKGLNVISCLMEIQRNPVTADGRKTTPVVWDSNCLEEVCGSCTMNINGRVRMACSALVDRLEQPITLEPLKKFPLDRDLVVDRERMFDSLKRVKAWIDLDGTHNLGPGPRQSPKDQSVMYVLSTCMTCAACVEACPQVTQNNDFVGAAAISQARLFNMNPTGAHQAEDRLHALMEDGGVHDCGKAQNCVEVCPKEIPLTTSIAAMNREVTKQAVKDLFQKEGEAHVSSGPA